MLRIEGLRISRESSGGLKMIGEDGAVTTKLIGTMPTHEYDVIKRKFSSILEISSPGFSPVHGEFDTVGFVIQVGDIKRNNSQEIILKQRDGPCLKLILTAPARVSNDAFIVMN